MRRKEKRAVARVDARPRFAGMRRCSERRVDDSRGKGAPRQGVHRTVLHQRHRHLFPPPMTRNENVRRTPLTSYRAHRERPK